MIGQEQLHHPAVDIWGSGAIHCLTFTRTMRFPLSVWSSVLAPLTPPYLVVCKTATAVLQPRRVPGKESKDDRDFGSSGPSWLVPRPLLGTDPFSGPVRLLDPRLQGLRNTSAMHEASPGSQPNCQHRMS
ncbi:uncharacterized protein P884DRAFT_255185 [Thermothelomyces heterothallicus CBS 202.75]|uniref:uncharacterized protein n=1 Tax=Thermothelomyces heterothallicus CBS 202.75 TaxID=1149848 RepID=UPI003743CF6C